MSLFGNVRALFQKKSNRKTHRQALALFVEGLEHESREEVVERWVPYAANHFQHLRPRLCQTRLHKIPESLRHPDFGPLFPRLIANDFDELQQIRDTLGPEVPVRLNLSLSGFSKEHDRWREVFDNGIDPSLLTQVSGLAFGVPRLWTDVRHEGLTWLLQAHFPRLQKLSLPGMWLDDDTFQQILNTSWMPQIRDLNISSNDLTLRSLKSLMHGPAGANLQMLRAHQNPWGAEAATAFDEAAHAGLMHLGLSGAGLGDDGVALLAQAPALKNLRHLDLDRNEITEVGVRSLAQSPYLNNVIALQLGSNNIDDQSAEVLGSFERLTLLDVKRTRVGDRLCEELARNNLQSLKTLHLSRTVVSDEGVEALANSPRFEVMDHLTLRCSRVSDRGLHALITSPHVKHLGCLSAWFSGLTEETKNAMISSRKLGLGVRLAAMCAVDSGFRSFWFREMGDANPAKLDWTHLTMEAKTLMSLLHWPELEGVRDFAIKRVDFQDDEVLRAFVSAPAFRELQALRLFRCALSRESMLSLLTSAEQGNWAHLGLDGSLTPTHNEVFRTFCQEHTLPNELDISNTAFSEVFAASFFDGHGFPGVTSLIARRVSMSDYTPLLSHCTDLVSLDISETSRDAASGFVAPLPKLKHLNMNRASCSVEAFQKFVQLPWPSLETLYLRQAHIGGTHLEEMAKSSNFPVLGRLDLGRNQCSLEDINGLMDAPGFPRLFSVTANQQHLNPEFLALLDGVGLNPQNVSVYAVEWFGSLQHHFDQEGLRRIGAWYQERGSRGILNLNQIPLTAEGLCAALSLRGEWRGRVNRLSLVDTGLTSEMFQEALTNASATNDQFSVLDLSDNPLGDGIFDVLRRTSAWNLRTLRLRNVGLTDASLDELSRCYLMRLDTLDLTHNQLTPEGLARISTFEHLSETVRTRYAP